VNGCGASNALVSTVSEQVKVSTHPLIKHKVTMLRDIDADPQVFRRLLHQVSLLLAYEVTHDLATRACSVTTPLAETIGECLLDKIALVPILRAGLGMVEGFWELIPDAEIWHIGVYRDHSTLQPIQYYAKVPPLRDSSEDSEYSTTCRVQLCLVLDPMLATGGSAVAAVNMLKDLGAPRIKFVGIVAAPEGVRALIAAHPDVDIHVAAIDSHLTPTPSGPDDPPEGYIVPGLGDAGDRQFGTG
jgi:uracil phosphoribosyltransferase